MLLHSRGSEGQRPEGSPILVFSFKSDTRFGKNSLLSPLLPCFNYHHRCMNPITFR